MQYRRMPIEVESPEQLGYDKIKYNLTESSYADMAFGDLGLELSPGRIGVFGCGGGQGGEQQAGIPGNP